MDMVKAVSTLFLVISCVLASTCSLAASLTTGSATTLDSANSAGKGSVDASIVTEVSAAEQEKVKAAIKKSIPELSINTVSPAPLPGFYQIGSGADIFYASADGRYVLYGSILDLSRDKKTWNLTDQVRNQSRRELIAAVDKQDMIIFSPKGQAKSSVVVFTDLDCVFCQRFHKNINDILEQGIEVRYMSFPREGIGSHGYKQAVSVWCADDKAAMLTLAESGGEVPDKQCAGNIVATQAKLGEKLGIKGTPTIIFADGFMLTSYLEPKDLTRLALEHSQ